MTQQDKDLLLKDLCGRLPYGIKAAFFDTEDECENFDVVEYIDVSNKEHEIGIGQYCLSIDKIKPYLFPLSSMTEEQKEELEDMDWSLNRSFDDFEINNIIECLGNHVQIVTHFGCSALINWLNKNHFDYRGLIPMGLAKDATGLNIY